MRIYLDLQTASSLETGTHERHPQESPMFCITAVEGQPSSIDRQCRSGLPVSPSRAHVSACPSANTTYLRRPSITFSLRTRCKLPCCFFPGDCSCRELSYHETSLHSWGLPIEAIAMSSGASLHGEPLHATPSCQVARYPEFDALLMSSRCIATAWAS